jgi:hypothetical protein
VPLMFKENRPVQASARNREVISREELLNENYALRASLRNILDDINNDSERNSRGKPRVVTSARGSQSSRSHVDPKVELEAVLAKIARLRSEYEKCHQQSAYRLIGDQISATKHKLSEVRAEIDILKKESIRQKKVLASNKTHIMIQSLEQEILLEKQLHAEMKARAKDLAQLVQDKQSEYTNWTLHQSQSDIEEFHNDIAQLRDEIYNMQRELCDNA